MDDSSEEALPERLPYHSDRFVDRDTEIDLVLQKTAQLANGAVVEKRVVIFHGFRGVGKSWLLQEIGNRLGGSNPAPAFIAFLDLSKFIPPSYQEKIADEQVALANDIVSTTILYVDGHVKIRTGFSSSSSRDPLYEQAERLKDNIRRLTEPLVLLVDHVDESPRKVLEQLEDRFLAPLVVLPKVLIVLAGRGREYTWKKEEFRLKCDERDLVSFDLHFTEQQLAKQIPGAEAKAAEIFSTSGGYPWTNYLLAKHSVSDLAALDQCADFLLRGLPVSDDAYDYLQALSVLRVIHDETILPLLSAYFGDSSYDVATHRQGRSRAIRQALIQTTLVKWVEESGGYVMDEALSNILEHRLYLRDPDCWTRLHVKAKELFTGWISSYPRTAARWEAEAAFHDGRAAHGPYWTPAHEEEK